MPVATKVTTKARQHGKNAPGDLLLTELRTEIDVLDVDKQHELVALVWLGREDFAASEWPEALELAEERHDGPTSSYLLSHPRVADQIASGT